MKKIILLTAIGASTMGAFAQKANQLMFSQARDYERSAIGEFGIAERSHAIGKKLPKLKTTSTPFATVDFGTGIPTGWTVSSPVGGNWTWRTSNMSGYFSFGTIASTTVSNGYMVYRADSLSSAFPTQILEGYLTSTPFNCTGHTMVGVTFEQFFRRFQDSCYVDVSINNGANWTAFEVFPNNTMISNDVTDNPHTAVINISSVAANQASVILRFRYAGRTGGAYSWMIDDLALVDLDPVELGISGSGVIMYVGPGTSGSVYGAIGAVPRQFVDTLWPLGLIANYGGTAPSSVNLTTSIYSGASQAFTKTYNFPTVPVNTYDGFADILNQPGFYSTTTGSYTAVANVNHPSDALASNNQDTVMFGITDSVWSQEEGPYTSIYYVHRPSSHANGERSDFIGTRIYTPADKEDTLTSISVSFHNSTTAGVTVSAQVYKFDGSAAGWTYVGTTHPRTLTTADISPANQQVFTTFQMDINQSGGFNIIGEQGTYKIYAAVVQGHNVPPASTVRLWATKAPSASIFGSGVGLSDSSRNNGAKDFAQGHLPFTLGNAAPAIRFNFGNNASALSVHGISENVTEINAYPNPANSAVTFAFSVKKSSDVQIRILNTLGQVVKQQTLANVSEGQRNTVSVNTLDMPEGVYFYTLETNGETITKQLVITH